MSAGVQVRPAARKLSDTDRQTARALYAGVAAGNAVVVQRLLAERVSVGPRVRWTPRTCDDSVHGADARQEVRAKRMTALMTT